MTQPRRLPMCGMCGGNSTRLVQTMRGTFLLCATCEPPTQAGAVTATEPMEPPKPSSLDKLTAQALTLAAEVGNEDPDLRIGPRKFKLPPLPARKFNLPTLPPRKRVVVAPQTAQRKTPVVCVIDYTYRENEREFDQECVVAECSACGHTEQSWGHGDKSVRRCLVLMGQNCPRNADNFYILERDE